MIIFISDFDLRGSGYMNIAVSLCNELVSKHGYRVTALGISYDKSEHNWPFSIIPVEQADIFRSLPAMVHNFRHLAETNQWYPVEAIVVALDIPLQEKMLQIDRGGIPYVGIFPIESGPLCASWGASISLMTEALAISEFGALMMEEQGIDGKYMPVGIDCESWRPPGAEERKRIRGMLGFSEDEFIVLTVADNQERKNLSVAMSAMAEARKQINAKWVLVTRVQSPVGWKLNDLAASHDMTEHLITFDRGLPFERLWILYAAADAFLLTSKAEGLCLPVLEAMATKTPVVAANNTAIPEHIYSDPDWSRVKNGSWGKGKPKDQRGFTIPIEFTTVDPWGNSVRSFADPKEAARLLIRLSKMKPEKLEPMLEKGMIYAKDRTWARAGNVLDEAIRRARIKATPIAPPGEIPMGALPASAPRPIPPMYTLPDTGGFEDEQQNAS